MRPTQPLLKVPQTAEIMPMMHALIAEYDKTIDAIVSSQTPESATFETVVRPCAHTDNAMQPPLCAIHNLQYCSPSLETQDAVREALKAWREAEAKWSRRGDYFELLQAAQENEQSSPQLNQESAFLLEERIRNFTNCGYGKLSQTEIQDYLKGRLEIDELCSKYKRNSAQEDGGIWFHESELDGVPADTMAKWKRDEQEPSKVFMPFANGGQSAVVKHAHDADVRRRVFIANSRKLLQNEALLQEIIQRRCEQAKKLGFSHHAAFRARGRAVKSSDWIDRFLDDLKPRLVSLAAQDVETLQSFRLEDRKRRGIFQEGDEKSFPNWEWSYYGNLIRQRLDVDETKISEYFPLEHVINAMLGLFSAFLGLRFDRIPDDELEADVKWHDSVDIFAVWDGPSDDADFVGYLYMDLIWREHKYRGNQNVNLECGYLKPDGSRKYPSTVLSCGLPTPAPGVCKLLKHHEVKTIFHELGHAIHDLLSRTEFVEFHGSNRLPVDAGEMPSMFLENYVWEQDVLSELSRHFTTLDQKYLEKWRDEHPGEPDPPRTIPKDLVQALQRSRYVIQGVYYADQLMVCMFDMKIHSLKSAEEAAAFDVRDAWYSLSEELVRMDYDDVKTDGSEFTTFAHLVSGYDTGYYGYMACNAFAQDIWLSEFAKNPRDRETWDRYRRMILEYGGAHPEKLTMLKDFLGREPNPNALVESLEQNAAKI